MTQLGVQVGVWVATSVVELYYFFESRQTAVVHIGGRLCDLSVGDGVNS